MRCNSWTMKPYFTYLYYIHKVLPIPALHTSQYPYIQETSYTKWEANNEDKQ